MNNSLVQGLGDVFNDFLSGIRNYRVWWGFGWLDIKLRYRRTTLGPFWATIGFLAMGIAVSLVYSVLLNVSSADYLAYLITGLAVWTFVSGLVIESCYTFTSSTGLILERKLAFTTHALRLVARNLMLFGHNFVAVVCVLVFFRVPVTPWTLLAIPGMAIILLNGLWASMLIGLASTRYRDLAQLVTLIVTLTFFVTPIFWKREMLSSRGFIADFNPLYHFIEILRAPLLGQAAAMTSWMVTLGITAAGLALTAVFFAIYLRRLPYWL